MRHYTRRDRTRARMASRSRPPMHSLPAEKLDRVQVAVLQYEAQLHEFAG